MSCTESHHRYCKLRQRKTVKTFEIYTGVKQIANRSSQDLLVAVPHIGIVAVQLCVTHVHERASRASSKSQTFLVFWPIHIHSNGAPVDQVFQKFTYIQTNGSFFKVHMKQHKQFMCNAIVLGAATYIIQRWLVIMDAYQGDKANLMLHYSI